MPTMSREPSTVSVVIPVRDDAGRLAGCLKSLRACDYPADRIELVVADNGSTDDSAAVAARAGALVLSLPGLTVAQVRNVAAQHCRGDVIAFVDADHEVDADWLRAATAAIAAPRVGMAGAPYQAPPRSTWVQRAFDAMRSGAVDNEDIDWLASGNMAVRRPVFEAVGGFDASLETCEDVDLCRKVRAHGFRVVAAAKMKSFHFGDPPTLRALFFTELWRGRDNLAASFRRPIMIRGLPSALIPVLEIGLAVAGVAGLFYGRRGFAVTAGAAALVLALTAARASKMLRRGRGLRRGHPLDVARALVVALVYDSARAIALVVRAGHHRRLSGAVATSAAETTSHEQADSRTGAAQR